MPKTVERDPLLKLADVLEELDVAKSTFFRWRACGRAPRAIKYPNGEIRFRRSAIDRWLAANEETA